LLSDRSRPVIEATLPVGAENIEEIARRFYAHLFGAQPELLDGTYVSVKVRLPDGVHQPRQYSLTRADDGEHRQFSVKRVRGGDKPDGEVSNLLCDQVQVGDVLTLSLPFGDVVLDDSRRPVIFASAGIGITPMAGMLSYYLCGPLPFMRSVRSALIDRDVPARDIQYEVFGPDLWQADLDTEPTPGATADRVAPPS
jgi:ferredoxin-NADP reductase